MKKCLTAYTIFACLFIVTGTTFADKPKIAMHVICPVTVSAGKPLVVTLQFTSKESTGTPPVAVSRVVTSLGSGNKKNLLANLFIQGPRVRNFGPVVLAPGESQSVDVEVVADTPSRYTEAGATAGTALIDDRGKILDSDYCFVEVI